jgi:hypothetical protein
MTRGRQKTQRSLGYSVVPRSNRCMITTMFEQLGTAIDAAIDAAIDELLNVEVDQLDDNGLQDLTVRLQRVRHRLDAAATRITGAWEARRGWTDNGSKSAVACLARDCGMAEPSTRRVLHRARRLRTMPATARAFADGALSTDAVDLLARANTTRVRSLFQAAEPMLVGQARSLRYSDLSRVVAYWRQCADDAGTGSDAEAQHDRRHGSAARTIDGMVHARAWLDPVGGTIVLNELERLERDLYLSDVAAARGRLGREPRRHELDRDAGQRMADAYAEMARRSASLDRPVTARPLITVLVGWETLQGRMCQTADGTVIHPHRLDGLLGDCDIERVVFDGPSRVIDVGIRRRFFTGALRRAIEVRDRHCTHPAGCDAPYERCDVDHTIPFAQGGPTTQANGRLRCATHNRHPDHRDAGPAGLDHDECVRLTRRRLHRLVSQLARDGPDPP